MTVVKGIPDWRFLLVILIVWSGTVSGLFALEPKIVDIKPFDSGFVMARSDGMLTWTDIEGVATDSVKTRMKIAGISVKDGIVLAVSPECRVLGVERNGRKRQLCRNRIGNSTDNVVGITCMGDRTFILTEGGVLMSTVDFDSFNSFDFNGTYSLYYDETRFSAICASDNFICIAGTYLNGMPAVYTSASGNIWSERTLVYTEGSETLELERLPLGMGYDDRMDRFVLSCSDGYLFYMPGCSHCNSIERKSMADISALAFNSGTILFR